MRSIVPVLTDKLRDHFKDINKVGSSEPYLVKSFRELVEHLAKLSFGNKDHLLFYRGQSKDHLNKANSSTFYPTIYRGDYLPRSDLRDKFNKLERYCKSLVDIFVVNNVEGTNELKRRKALQWSILQHYKICDTPLLDFTQSLRSACSFATPEKDDNRFGYIFIFGLPYITNRITINTEQDIINVRLLSICPPTALRPYFQEGYLAGTDEITDNYISKSELDFNNRLIAKFKFRNDDTFWGNGIDRIPEQELFPDNDPVFHLCAQIKEVKDEITPADDIGKFLLNWVQLEEKLLSMGERLKKQNVTIREAISLQYKQNLFSKEELKFIDNLRIFRNRLVHSPQRISSSEVAEYSTYLKTLLKKIKKIK